MSFIPLKFPSNYSVLCLIVKSYRMNKLNTTITLVLLIWIPFLIYFSFYVKNGGDNCVIWKMALTVPHSHCFGSTTHNFTFWFTPTALSFFSVKKIKQIHGMLPAQHDKANRLNGFIILEHLGAKDPFVKWHALTLS